MPLKLLSFRKHPCAECDRQRAILEAVRREAPPGVDFRDIDVDGAADAVAHYKVRDHPVTVLEKDGHEVLRWTGVVGKDVVVEALRQHGAEPGKPAKAPVAGAPLAPGAVGAPGKVAMPPPERAPPPGEPMPPPPEPPGPPMP